MKNLLDKKITRFTLQSLISATLSLGLLALLLHIVARSGDEVNLSMVFEAIKGIPLDIILIYIFLVVGNMVLRTFRYRVILAGTANQKLSFPFLFVITGVRNMVVDLLPARLGELVFVSMLKRSFNTPISNGMATLALSLMLDAFILIPLFLIIGLFPLASADFREGALPVATLLGLVLILIIFILWPFGHFCLKKICLILGEKNLFGRITKFLLEISNALNRCRKASILAKTLMLTIAIRVLKYGSLYLLFDAIVSIVKFESLDSELLDVVVALVASEAGASLPVPTIMSFGTYEAGGAAALVLLGYSIGAAVIVLLSVHIASQIVDYLIGCGCLAVYFLFSKSHKEKKYLTSKEKYFMTSRTAIVLVAIGLVATLVLSFYQLKKVRAAHSQIAPPPGYSLSKSEKYLQIKAFPPGIKGWIVWSSNRFGNHDILKMDLANGLITRLTTHSHAETYPRISPDGMKVVFARSRETWVSLRDPKPWDIYILDLASGKEKLLAEFGSSPTWSKDGSSIYFQRGESRVMQLTVKTGVEQTLYAAGKGIIPKGVELQTPSIGAITKGLASTWRGKKRMTTIVDVSGSLKPIGNGCQITWSPDEKFVYWIDHGGKMQNQLYRQFIGESEPKAWLDLEEPFSHEYFPKLSTNSEYLVLGASAGGHEHDVADYEIFLWKISDPSESAIRLTFHSGNDNWPDIFLDQTH